MPQSTQFRKVTINATHHYFDLYKETISMYTRGLYLREIVYISTSVRTCIILLQLMPLTITYFNLWHQF